MQMVLINECVCVCSIAFHAHAKEMIIALFIIPYQMVFLIYYRRVQFAVQTISSNPIEQIEGICQHRIDFFRHQDSNE